MECSLSRYSWVDLAFSVVGVCTFLVDWGSDIWVAAEFYCRGDVLWFGVLVGLMALSSVVVQLFSWFWIQYDRLQYVLPGGEEPQSGGEELQPGGEEPQPGGEELQSGGEEPQSGGEELQSGGEEPQSGGEEPQPGGEELQPGGEEPQSGGEELQPGGEEPQSGGSSVVMFGDRVKLSCAVHVLQLGFLCRHLWVIRQGFWTCWRCEEGSEMVVYLTHDLSMLRLIETFCESAPQLTLMVYVMLQTQRARTVQLVSLAASSSSMAWMVVDYHRSLRSFVPHKAQQRVLSSLMYFLWNLLLMVPRMAVLALFCSVMHSLLLLHFLFLWLAFLFWAWTQRTHFMECQSGEWLYRATVGLIWYFSWFNVSEGATRGRSIIYHVFMTADCILLLSTWWQHRDQESSQLYAPVLLLVLPLLYTCGLILKTVYYCCFHPRLWRPHPPELRPRPLDLPDSELSVWELCAQDRSGAQPLVNRRMKALAQSFYNSKRV